jgi:hypothetical protein
MAPYHTLLHAAAVNFQEADYATAGEQLVLCATASIVTDHAGHLPLLREGLLIRSANWL